VIITAYPTIGETWETSKNEDADQKLEEELKFRKTWIIRIEGYSPETGHAEPGRGTTMPIEEACEIGLPYRQDAIFHVMTQYFQ